MQFVIVAYNVQLHAALACKVESIVSVVSGMRVILALMCDYSFC